MVNILFAIFFTICIIDIDRFHVVVEVTIAHGQLNLKTLLFVGEINSCP